MYLINAMFSSCGLSTQFNFVGRILGPRGLTAKQLEAETGCKIMVRGKGSMRDKKKVNFYFLFLFAFQKLYFIIWHIDGYACRYRICAYAWLMHVKCRFRQLMSNGIFTGTFLSHTTMERKKTRFFCLPQRVPDMVEKWLALKWKWVLLEKEIFEGGGHFAFLSWAQRVASFFRMSQPRLFSLHYISG